MIVPQIPGRTVTSTLMRDAIAAEAKFLRRNSGEIFNFLSPAQESEAARLFGSKEGIMRFMLKESIIPGFKTKSNVNPAGVYRDIFAFRGHIPFMTKLHMLNEAPLAALGIGPKSRREAELAKRQKTVLSNESKKSIAGMAIS